MVRHSLFALALVIAAAHTLAAQPPAVRTITLPDPSDKPKYHCWEPHVAVDPDYPDRVLVAAMYRGQIGQGEKARGDSMLVVWRSEDAGRTWSAPATPFLTRGRPTERLGADPVLAFGPKGAAWLVGDDYDWRVPGTSTYSSIKTARSDDGGKTWDKPLTVAELDNDKKGKGLLDKPWVAVDRTEGKRAGTVYVAWSHLNEDKKRWELRCAALPPGGKQFTDGVTLGEPTKLEISFPSHQVQLAVRSDGTLDAVWVIAEPKCSVHAYSQDGGATFSKPKPIAADEKTGAGQFPSLTATADGRLLAAWSNQGAVRAAVHASGKWSSAQPPAGKLPEGVRLTHPAVAASAEALWVLAYRHEKTPARVRVVLYRSTDGEKWAEHATLAARDMTEGRRVMSPGDYIGLAAAKNRVYAAYVLPGEGKDGLGPRLYVSALNTAAK